MFVGRGERPHNEMIGARISFAAALVFLTYRAFFGIEFGDEAAYLAIPLQFARGAIPFLDETSLLQLAGVLLYPFVKVFLIFSPRQEAIVLFGRLLFLLGWATAWLLIERLLRASAHFSRGFSKPTIAWAALVWLPFTPNNVLGLCYNSFGLLFLALGLAAAWRYHRNWGPGAWQLSCYLSFATWCYPSYATILIPYLLAWWWAQGSDRRRWVTPLLLGSLPLFLLGAGLATLAGGKSFVTTFQGFTGQGNELALVRLWSMLKLLIPAAGPYRLLPLLISAAIVLRIASKKWERPAAYAGGLFAIAIAVLLATANYFGGIHLGYSIVTRAVFWLPLVVVAFPIRSPSAFLGVVWLPCLMAGLVASMSSTFDEKNFGLGVGPSLFFLVAWIGQWIEERYETLEPKMRVLTPAIAIALGAMLARADLFGSFFWDDPYSKLTHQMKRGPYRYLYTSPEKGAFLERISANVDTTVPDGSWVTFLLMPGGLLQKPLRNAAASVWIVCDPKILSAHLAKMESRPGRSHYLVLFSRLYYNSSNVMTLKSCVSDHAFRAKIESEFSPVYSDDEMVIMKRKPY